MKSSSFSLKTILQTIALILTLMAGIATVQAVEATQRLKILSAQGEIAFPNPLPDSPNATGSVGVNAVDQIVTVNLTDLTNRLVKGFSVSVIGAQITYEIRNEGDIIGDSSLAQFDTRFNFQFVDGSSKEITGCTGVDPVTGYTTLISRDPCEDISVAFQGSKATIAGKMMVDGSNAIELSLSFDSKDATSQEKERIHLNPSRLNLFSLVGNPGDWQKNMIQEDVPSLEGAPHNLNSIFDKYFISKVSGSLIISNVPIALDLASAQISLARIHTMELTNHAEVNCDDDQCSVYETAFDCPIQCGFCGDSLCTVERGENHNACPLDCPVVCGDAICSADEDLNNCPQDCAVCGDGTCSPNEDLGTCQQDCEICGNGSCGAGEDSENCPQDCGPSSCSDFLGQAEGAACEMANDCVMLVLGPPPYPPEFNDFIASFECQSGCCNGPSVCDLNSPLGNISCTANGGDAYCSAALGFTPFTDCNEAAGCCQGTACGDGVCGSGEEPSICPEDCGGSGGECSDFAGVPGGLSCAVADDCAELLMGPPPYPPELAGFIASLECQSGCCNGPAVCEPDAPLGNISCTANGGDAYCGSALGVVAMTDCSESEGCCQPATGE